MAGELGLGSVRLMLWLGCLIDDKF